MKTGILVNEAMTHKPVTVTPDVNVYQCAKLMAEMHISSVIVRDNGHIVGIVTEQDLVRKIVGQKLGFETPLKDIMSTNLVTITPEKDIFEALVLMKERNIRRVPVVNPENENELEGFITGKDILKIQPQLFQMLAETIELRESDRKPIHRFIPTEGFCKKCAQYSDELLDVKGNLLCSKCQKSKEF